MYYYATYFSKIYFICQSSRNIKLISSSLYNLKIQLAYMDIGHTLFFNTSNNKNIKDRNNILL